MEPGVESGMDRVVAEVLALFAQHGHATYSERVTMDVGFYYMSNAAGRLVGTLLSGFTYQLGGLALCLGTAALMLALSALGTAQLRPSQTS